MGSGPSRTTGRIAVWLGGALVIAVLVSATVGCAATRQDDDVRASDDADAAAPGTMAPGTPATCEQLPTTTSSAPTTTRPGSSAVPAGGRPSFPLRVDQAHRQLVDASGQPFLIVGDTAWSLIAQLRKEEVIQYLDDRQSRGFNTIIVNLLESRFSSDPPNNIYGDPPFTSEGDYATPNEAYFEYADWVVAQAAERGIVVLLTPSYLGYGGGGEGWYSVMEENGPDKLREYGRYLGRRYGDDDNIVWMQAGDYEPPEKELVNAIAEGIAEFDPDALQTAHGGTVAEEYWGDAPWLTLNNIYTYDEVAPLALEQYERSKAPFFLSESTYENEHDADTRLLRTQAYQAQLAGAAGQVFGNNPIWHFSSGGIYEVDTTWQENLSSPGSQSMALLGQLFGGMRWWELEPDIGGQFLTDADEDVQAVAAVACDRSRAVVYVPSEREIELDLGRLDGASVALSWFDPTNGNITSAGDALPASGTQTVTTPGSNAEGSDDWVLLVEAQPPGG